MAKERLFYQFPVIRSSDMEKIDMKCPFFPAGVLSFESGTRSTYRNYSEFIELGIRLDQWSYFVFADDLEFWTTIGLPRENAILVDNLLDSVPNTYNFNFPNGQNSYLRLTWTSAAHTGVTLEVYNTEGRQYYASSVISSLSTSSAIYMFPGLMWDTDNQDYYDFFGIELDAYKTGSTRNKPQISYLSSSTASGAQNPYPRYYPRRFFTDDIIFYDGEDPYKQGGESTTGGGEGTFDNTSVDVGIPSLPGIGAKSSGFITLFTPTETQLNDLATYMWTNSAFDVSTWKKLFADPMDAILGLSIVPVSVSPTVPRTVKVGNLSTGLTMDSSPVQYVEIDCGSITVNEYWGSYLDYSPYTKIDVYLPYIGMRALNADDVMGKTVSIKYHVDILTGACCAYISCGGTVLYSYVGNCATPIPITGNDWSNVINGALTTAASIGTTVLTGGATAPAALGVVGSEIINNIKPTVERSGSMSGSGGLLGVQTPYLILTRPRQALPAGQNTFTGYPVYISSSLSDISGYTEVDKIHLENIPATGDELSEIETLLKSGVIL